MHTIIPDYRLYFSLKYVGKPEGGSVCSAGSVANSRPQIPGSIHNTSNLRKVFAANKYLHTVLYSSHSHVTMAVAPPHTQFSLPSALSAATNLDAYTPIRRGYASTCATSIRNPSGSHLPPYPVRHDSKKYSCVASKYPMTKICIPMHNV